MLSVVRGKVTITWCRGAFWGGVAPSEEETCGNIPVQLGECFVPCDPRNSPGWCLGGISVFFYSLIRAIKGSLGYHLQFQCILGDHVNHVGGSPVELRFFN